MTIFDRWTELDPALALRRIEAAHGAPIFDRFSYLDPQRALLQIESALGIELDDVNGLLDPSTLEDAIDAAVEGSDIPEWVPADAKIYIDLVNDRAWTEADGEVAINTLLGADANSGAAWGNPTEYDPANLDANGYTYAGNDKLAFIDALKTTLAAGATMRFQFRNGATGVDGTFFLGDTPPNQHALEFDFNTGAATNGQTDAYIFNGDFDAASDIAIMNKGDGAINAVAFTFTETRFEYAANGSTVYGGSITGGGTLPSGITTVALISLQATYSLQSITIYDALPSTAGLSALSETGVTNTAPSAIIATNWSGSFTDTTDVSASTPAGDTGEGNIAFIASTSDPEGNPVVYSWIDDGDGLFFFAEDGFTPGQVRTHAITLSAGTITATLRATDPGGLYVEQEFTITVTA